MVEYDKHGVPIGCPMCGELKGNTLGCCKEEPVEEAVIEEVVEETPVEEPKEEKTAEKPKKKTTPKKKAVKKA